MDIWWKEIITLIRSAYILKFKKTKINNLLAFSNQHTLYIMKCKRQINKVFRLFTTPDLFITVWDAWIFKFLLPFCFPVFSLNKKCDQRLLITINIFKKIISLRIIRQVNYINYKCIGLLHKKFLHFLKKESIEEYSNKVSPQHYPKTMNALDQQNNIFKTNKKT